MMATKISPFTKNKSEICWNLVNSGIAAALVLLGSFTTGRITWTAVGIAVIAALIVFFTKFWDYWKKEEHEYKTKKIIFQFVN